MTRIFATKDNLIQPKQRAFIEPRKPKDHLMGEVNLAGLFAPTLPDLTDGHWHVFEPSSSELEARPQQRLIDGEDTDWCVSESARSIDRAVHFFRYGTDLPTSVRFTAIGSKTVRGQGNGVSTVAEFIRTKGFVFEHECPFNPNGTMDDAYADLDPNLFTIAAKNLNFYEFPYQFVNNPNPVNQLVAIKKSPLWVTVEGRYVLDDNGRLINTGAPFSHQVKLDDFILGQEWHISDSETRQDIRVDWNYKFGSVTIRQVKKKYMTTFLKRPGSPAIYVPDCDSGLPVPFADGSVAGGKVFKTIYGVNYNQLNYQDLDQYLKNKGFAPDAIENWQITSQPKPTNS